MFCTNELVRGIPNINLKIFMIAHKEKLRKEAVSEIVSKVTK